jgi:hypothetical protein
VAVQGLRPELCVTVRDSLNVILAGMSMSNKCTFLQHMKMELTGYCQCMLLTGAASDATSPSRSML